MEQYLNCHVCMLMYFSNRTIQASGLYYSALSYIVTSIMFQEKSGGKVIHRVGGVIFLYRGRHYDPRTRPRYPLMLWKPATPVYPKLIKEVPEGLTKEEADEMRRKGHVLPPICKLGINLWLNLILMDNCVFRF